MRRKSHDRASRTRTGTGEAMKSHGRIMSKEDMVEIDRVGQHVISETCHEVISSRCCQNISDTLVKTLSDTKVD